MPRGVVITGLGTVSGFGAGISALWDGMLEGRSAHKRIEALDPSGFPTHFAAEARGFSAKEHVPKHYRKALKVMARDTEMAVACAKFAVEDAGLLTKAVLPEDAGEGAAGGVKVTYPPARVGCQIGAGLIAAEVPELAVAMASSVDSATGVPGAANFSYAKWGGITNDTAAAPSGSAGAGMDNLTPLWLLKYLPNMLSCHVTILHDARGPSNTITCSEASGLLSVGESMRVIERGAADACFSGSCESKINHMGIQRLLFSGRLASTPAGTTDVDAWKIVKPYDPRATGGLLGEGGGILLLESDDTAKARGAKPKARLLGFGAGLSSTLGSQADHLGLQYAIENALEDAGVRADEIDAIVPQGSGVRESDAAELVALRAVFGARLKDIPLVTLAPMIGECVAGAGGLAVAVAAMCVAHQALPARLHAGECPTDIQAGPAPSRDARLKRILVCTPSIGGQAAAVILGPAA